MGILSFFNPRKRREINIQDKAISLNNFQLPTSIELYCENNLAKNIIIKPVNDALRNWINLSDSNIKEVEKQIKEHNIIELCIEAITKSRIFGSVLVVANINDINDYNEEIGNVFLVRGFTVITEYTTVAQENTIFYQVSTNKGTREINSKRAIEIITEKIDEDTSIGVLHRKSGKRA